MKYETRKWISIVEEIGHDGGPQPAVPLIKAAVGAVIRNPFAGRYVDDLSDLIAPSAALGDEMGRRAVGLLSGRPVESYGKGGIVGVDGEQEHVVACITTTFGDALRAAIGGGVAWISSVTKSAAAGQSADIPLAHKDALYVRSHYDAMTFAVPDGPRPDEFVVVVAVATGGRIHSRVGGLSVEDAVGDGLR